MARREYKGNAQAAYLTAPLGGSTGDTTITCDDLTNWPTGTGSKPFFIVIDRGLASEEKILCSSRTGNTLTVFDDGLTNGRGSDETAITSHANNATVEHVFTATDADEANEHVNATTGTVHGLALADVVTTSATQTLTNKTLSSPDINTPDIDGGTIDNTTITGGSVVDATEVSLTGAQTLADYRVRNTYAATVAPTAGSGNDGDLWVQYES